MAPTARNSVCSRFILRGVFLRPPDVVSGEGNARRPVSRVLSRAEARAMAIHLGRPSPGASRDRPGRLIRKPTAAVRDRLAPLYGLAPGGVCRAGPVAGPAVRSYRTLSPLPAGLTARAGGLLSVALSLGSPPPGVTRLRASVEPGLSSTARRRRRPSGRLADSGYASTAARSRLSPGRRQRRPPPRTVPAALSRRGKWRAPCAGHESADARRSLSIRRIAEASAPAATSPCSSSLASARLPAWPSGSRRPRA